MEEFWQQGREDSLKQDEFIQEGREHPLEPEEMLQLLSKVIEHMKHSAYQRGDDAAIKSLEGDIEKIVQWIANDRTPS